MMTWDSINKGSKVILSNNNMTAYHTNNTGGAIRSSGYKQSSGKWYAEFKITGTQHSGLLGVCNEFFDFSLRTDTSPNLENYRAGQLYVLGGSSGTSLLNKTLRLLLNFDDNLLEIHDGNTSLITILIGDLVGQNFYIFASSTSVSSNFYSEANFGDSNFMYSVPNDYKPFGLTILNKSFILLSDGYKKWVEGKPAVASDVSVIPIMTSNTSPSGIAKASHVHSAPYDAWLAFDDSIVSKWNSGTSPSFPVYLEYEFNNPIIAIKYGLTVDSVTLCPKDWTFEGSNDGVSWTVLDTRSGALTIVNTRFIFDCSPVGSYKKYRLKMTSVVSGIQLNVSKFEIFAEGTPAIPPSWQTISTTLPSVDTFKSDGMDNLSELGRKSVVFKYPMNDNTLNGELLGSGKMFKEKVNIKNLIDIKSIQVK